MKNLYLVFSNLKNMITENKFILCFFCIGVLACNVMFIYFFGNMKTAAFNSYHSTYKISNEKRSLVDIDRAEKELSDYVFRIEYSTMLNEKSFDGNSNQKSNIDSYITENKNQNGGNFKDKITAIKDINKIFLMKGKASDLKSNNTIGIPFGFPTQTEGFTEIAIDNTKYKIIGTADKGYIVSLDTYKNNKLNPDLIDIIVDGSVTGSKKTALEAKLNELFPDFTITYPEPNKNDLFDEGIIIICALYLLCLFSLMFFMTYLFEQSAYEMNVYEIIGAKRSKIIMLLCSVQFIVVTFISAVSLLAHRLFYYSFFMKFNIEKNTMYSFGDYLSCFALTDLLSFLFVFTYILIRVRKSVIVNSRKFIN